MDIFFCKRVDTLFATIFVDSGLSCKLRLKKCEYKKRGTVHIHIYLCLDCNPDIIKSTKIVLKACIAEFSMD